MKILEFGDNSKRKIILIHGFQCPCQVWNKYIEYYKEKFHIFVPIMSGHNPEIKEDFISFASDAKKISSPLHQMQRKLRIIFFLAMRKKYMLYMVCQWAEY